VQLSSSFPKSGILRRNYSLCAGLESNRNSILTPDLVKIFGRMAENYLLLDVPGAGTPEMMNCCHGGCDNCNYSHIFDNLSSGRPKWIPLYCHRSLIDGRNHVSKWSSIFADEFTHLSSSEFVEKFLALKYEVCLGPALSVPVNDLPTTESIIALYNLLLHSNINDNQLISDSSRLTANDVSIQMQKKICLFNTIFTPYVLFNRMNLIRSFVR